MKLEFSVHNNNNGNVQAIPIQIGLHIPPKFISFAIFTYFTAPLRLLLTYI